MNKKQIIIQHLMRILDELDARESSCNSVIAEYHHISWKDLCDVGIYLFKLLK